MHSSTNTHLVQLPRRNKGLKLTTHAQLRSAQRAIKPHCIPLLIAYGLGQHDGRGGIRYLMTDHAIESIERVLGHTPQLERLRGAYVVVGATDNVVITVGHHHQGRA
jgi:hypothetical protein